MVAIHIFLPLLVVEKQRVSSHLEALDFSDKNNLTAVVAIAMITFIWHKFWLESCLRVQLLMFFKNIWLIQKVLFAKGLYSCIFVNKIFLTIVGKWVGQKKPFLKID
jgi:hypothetical protein